VLNQTEISVQKQLSLTDNPKTVSEEVGAVTKVPKLDSQEEEEGLTTVEEEVEAGVAAGKSSRARATRSQRWGAQGQWQGGRAYAGQRQR
jgi:hypothetical protein